MIKNGTQYRQMAERERNWRQMAAGAIGQWPGGAIARMTGAILIISAMAEGGANSTNGRRNSGKWPRGGVISLLVRYDIACLTPAP